MTDERHIHIVVYHFRTWNEHPTKRRPVVLEVYNAKCDI